MDVRMSEYFVTVDCNGSLWCGSSKCGCYSAFDRCPSLRDDGQCSKAVAEKKRSSEEATKDARIAALTAQLEERETQYEACKQQAIQHAQEARTQAATVGEIYQIVSGGRGEPGDWNGAEPVRKAFAVIIARTESLSVQLQEVQADYGELDTKLFAEVDRADKAEQALAATRDLHERWMRAIAELAVEFGISTYDDMPGKWYELISARLRARSDDAERVERDEFESDPTRVCKNCENSGDKRSGYVFCKKFGKYMCPFLVERPCCVFDSRAVLAAADGEVKS